MPDPTFRQAVECFNVMAWRHDGAPLTDTGVTDQDALASLSIIGARLSSALPGSGPGTVIAAVLAAPKIFALTTLGFIIRGDWGVDLGP